MAVIEAIETIYLEADAASVTFSGIPTTYEHLQLRMSLRSQDSGTGGYWGNIKVRLNDSSAYSYHSMGGGDPLAAGSNAARVINYSPDSYVNAGYASNDLHDAANYAGGVLDILDYADDGNKNTTMLFLTGHTGTNPAVFVGSGLWDNTDDVTSVTVLSNSGLWRGSEFTLYGLNSS
tara:strand:+ start:317 stop:847 length:531 start_codon:yes stop_codon:yes gene_type:complete